MPSCDHSDDSPTKQSQQAQGKSSTRQTRGPKRARLEYQLIDLSEESPRPAAKLRPLAVPARQNVFLEGYTDSPEHIRVDNPVVYMEEEVLPEEREKERVQPRRHPLRQVTNARDVAQSSVTNFDRNPHAAPRGAAAAPPVTISDDEGEEGLDEDTFEFLLR